MHIISCRELHRQFIQMHYVEYICTYFGQKQPTDVDCLLYDGTDNGQTFCGYRQLKIQHQA